MEEDYFLIRRMKKGDEPALEAFVRKHYPEILRYCYRSMNGNSLAEDITQETFASFFKNFSRYEHYGKARNYLYTIAGNLCRNHYRQKPEIALEEVALVSDELEEAVSTKLDIEYALMKLPADLREILILHYFQDLKQREIAAILKIGLPLVKYRLAKAKEKLKEMMGEEDGKWMK